MPWGGIDYDDRINLCLSAGHKTVKNLLETKAFTVSMGTEEQLTACDYVGIVSGNKVGDKLAHAGWHTVKSEFVNAPVIEELPMTVECELVSYDADTCHLVGCVRPGAQRLSCCRRKGGQRLQGRNGT